MELITVTQASRESGLSDGHIKRAASTGKLTAQKLGKTWVFTRTDFETWLATRNTTIGRPRVIYRNQKEA